jgi:catechol 2,3-dioxygenase-like lactoylglutathione lyase family enzyme
VELREPYPVGAIDHAAVPVRDLDASLRFYADTLGATCVRPPYVIDGRVAVQQIAIGTAALSLHRHGNGMELVGRGAQPGGLDICFRWNAPVGQAVEHLESKNIEIIEGPVPRISADGAKGQSIYFSDPDGNLIELMSVF